MKCSRWDLLASLKLIFSAWNFLKLLLLVCDCEGKMQIIIVDLDMSSINHIRVFVIIRLVLLINTPLMVFIN